MSAFLPDETRLARVHLRTRDLERALGFYTGTLGLQIAEPAGTEVRLVATDNGPPIIVLSEEPAAAPRSPETTGLFHAAIRFPARRDLAHAVRRLLRDRYSIQGASDHKVSEAIYLSDPDDNGLELYADRPRAQ